MPRQNLLYKNVYHALCTRVFSGEFPPGTRLPSMYDLAQSYQVSPTAIRATFKMMQDIGLIRVFRGKEAAVLYDADDPASQQTFCAWLAERKYTLSEVYHLTALMASTTAAFGATLVDETSLVQLQEIARRVQDPALPVNRLAFSLVDYYFVLIRPLRNDRLEDLMRACDGAISSAMLLAAQDDTICVQLADKIRQILLELHQFVQSGSYDRIVARVPQYAFEVQAFVFHHIDRLTAGLPDENGLHFDWTVSGNASLYSDIANDLILRICTGEFFDGEYLPAEQKLQKEYGASSKTVRNALVALNDRGIVRTVNGLGTLVTYLSSAEDKPVAVPHEAYIFFNALQLLMLNAESLARTAFDAISIRDIQLTRERVERLLTSKGNRFYSYAGILINIVVQNYPHALIRQIFNQFLTLLFLLCHQRQYFGDVFQIHFDQSVPYIRGALDALETRDVDRYVDNLRKVLSLVAKSTLHICKISGMHCDVTLPY